MEHSQPTKQENQKTFKVIQNDQQSPMFPFNILEETTSDNENEQKDFFVILGNEKVSQPFETQKQAEEYILQKPYELILALTFNTYKLLQHKEKEEKEIVELRKKQNNEKA